LAEWGAAPPGEVRNLALGRSGAPPGGHYGPPARSWLIGAKMPRKAWPGLVKVPHVERREARVRPVFRAHTPQGVDFKSAAWRSIPHLAVRGGNARKAPRRLKSADDAACPKNLCARGRTETLCAQPTCRGSGVDESSRCRPPRLYPLGALLPIFPMTATERRMNAT
jgi:hypothetical protein